MSPETKRLIEEIMAYELDEPAAADRFSQRLARENGWSELHAVAVVREYKRFLVLAVISERMVSPSDAVDQAWHLHLQHSARYRELEQNVLKRRLDHTPSSGGRDEQARYRDAYARTLERYADVFGELPPSDVWPAPSQRFGAGHAVRVVAADHWVIKKPRGVRALAAWLPPRLRGVRALLLTVGLCVALVASLSPDISGSAYLHGYFALWLSCLSVAVVARRAAGRREPEELPALAPYELLQLASGPLGAVDGAIARLIAAGSLEFDPALEQISIRGPLPKATDALERDLYEQVGKATAASVSSLRAKAGSLTAAAARRLEQLELTAVRRFDLAFWLTLVAPAFGLVRVVSRIDTDKPIGLLVFWLIVGLAVAAWVCRHRGRTTWGDAVLERARAEHRDASPSEALAATSVPLALALFGVAAVTLPATSAWLGWVASKPYTASTTSGGCGGSADSGCGSGCGGGCGGCGGCGGG